MVTGDGGGGVYPLLQQINIHEWKQWLQGMGIPLQKQRIFTNGRDKGWESVSLQKQLTTLCSPQENDTVSSP